MNRRSVHLWLWASSIVAVAVSPFLVQGDPQVRQLRELHRQQIARLSESDRERLERSLDEFRQLPPDEQLRVEQFHRQLTADAQQRQGLLAHTMETYLNWVRTLPPYQREALMNEADPRERLKLVREFVEQKEEREAQRQTVRVTPWVPPGITGLFRDAPLLTSQELATVMAELERRNGLFLSPEQKEQLGTLQGIERHIRMLRLYRDNNAGSWIVQPLRDIAVELLPDAQATQYMAEVEARTSEFENRERIVLVGWSLILGTTMVRELQRQRSVVPSDQALAELLHGLPAEEQDRLLSLEAADFRSELLRQYRQEVGQMSSMDVMQVLRPPDDGRRFQDEMRRLEGRPPFRLGDRFSPRNSRGEFGGRGNDRPDGPPDRPSGPNSPRPPRFPRERLEDNGRFDRQGERPE